MTQAAEHITVLLHEAVEGLAIKPDGIYVDGTFGRGGHSRLILQQLGPQGRLIAIDRDPQAIAEAAKIQDPRFEIVHGPFSGITTYLSDRGLLGKVDGFLLDLGVSSPQLDDAERSQLLRDMVREYCTYVQRYSLRNYSPLVQRVRHINLQCTYRILFEDILFCNPAHLQQSGHVFQQQAAFMQPIRRAGHIKRDREGLFQANTPSVFQNEP